MKALVLTAYNHLEIQEVPDPVPGKDEVLIRVRACGICGSDVHGMDGSSGRRIPPIIMGHEASGEIVALGADVGDWKEGTRVTFDSTIYCGRCWYCRRGAVHLCDQRRVLGVSCDEYRRHGAFAEYVVVPEHILYALPDDVGFVEAAMVEPLSIALHAIQRAPLRPADTVVIFGAGTIGLMLVQAVRVCGAGKVLVVDLEPRRLEIAAELGADHVLDASAMEPAGILEAVFEQTEGRGADVVFEAVGVKPTVSSAIDAARKGGCVVLVGNVTPNVELPLQRVVTREITLAGSCASQHDYPRCLELLARKAVQTAPLLSGVASLEQGPEMFRRLRDNSEGLLKVVLEP
ncbi:galactitol-1-phosphate 5-dehydrogenase [Thermostilla marina]